MEKFITPAVGANNYIKIKQPISLTKIYGLFKGNVLFAPEAHGKEYYMGIYYEIKKDYDNAPKYYILSMNKGNICAHANLVLHYYYMNDYKNMGTTSGYHLV